ncbi:MAG: hypothetical protein QM813_02755 [Verrucomicrobiota bacterium]
MGGGIKGIVLTLATDGTNLFAGGLFSLAGNTAATNLAKWDGTNWSSLGALHRPEEPDSNQAGVYSLLTDGTNLFAGGNFSSAGGSSATNIARWDGTSWHSLGDGLGIIGGDAYPAIVYDMARHGSHLFAAGVFINSGAVGVTNLARWTGASWEPCGNGVAGGITYILWIGDNYEEYSGSVYALCSTPAGLLVGGDFTQAGNVTATNLARWDGTNWSATGTASSGWVKRIVRDGTNHVILGYYSRIGGIAARGAAQLSGNSWTALGQGVYPEASSAARIGTNLYIGGDFQVASGQSAGFIAQWDGAGFKPLLPGESTAPRGGIRDMAIGSDGSLYLAGWFMTAGTAIANNIARYDVTNWFGLGEGFPSGAAPSRLALLGTNLFAAGGQWETSAGILGIGRWDGSNWTSVGGGLSQGVNRPFIQDLAIGTTNLFVVGTFDQAGGLPATNFAGWDGSQWKGYDYSSSAFVAAVTTRDEHPSVCEISGITDSTIQVREWDGFEWTTIGTPPIAMGSAYVHKMLWAGTNLFVAGKFVITNGFTATNLVRWDGQTWSGMNSPLGNRHTTILDMAWNGTNLFVCGGAEIEGLPALAKWNGTDWSTLGSGLGAALGDRPWGGALAARGRDLYIGGEFTTAGGKPADNLALWHDFPTVTLAARGWQPNGRFGLRIRGGQGQPVQVQSSTNLQSWRNVGTQLPDSDDYAFEDATATGTSKRFYQLQLMP